MSFFGTDCAYRDGILAKLMELREYLNCQGPHPNSSPVEFYRHLNGIKAILENANNDVSFVAVLMAKAYLANRFGEFQYDAAAKSQGAPGLDIDVAVGGKRVVGEVKTTTPCNGPDFGDSQRRSFERDFAKLAAAEADYKFMFVTETAAFKILCRPSFRAKLAGAMIVQLTSGAEVQA